MSTLKKESEKQGKSLHRIERALLGDDGLQDVGFAKMITESYDYVRKNKEAQVIERAIPAITFFENWEKESKWGEIDKVLKDKFVSAKVIAWLNVGSWAGVVALILSVGAIIEMLKRTGLL